ncbi:MAG TPA: O-antigen ligase family protein [Cellvibrio sp.]|nr:O-antigen ligase family protein [Cellvibrio sp.]
MFKTLKTDFLNFYKECREQDFGFYCVAAYLIFSYVRPQEIFPSLKILPWTQLCIMCGLVFAIVKSTFKIGFAHVLVFIYFLVCLASAYFSVYPEVSFRGEWDIVLIWLMEMAFITSCVNNLTKFRLMLIIFFIALFKISFYGAREWISRGFGFRDYGISGPSGYFNNSGELSLIMAMLAVMSFAFICENKQARKMYYLLPITALMTVIAASSRGSQLALVIGTVLYFLIKGRLSLKYLCYGALIAWLGYMALPDKQKERFSSSGDDTTSRARLMYWSSGVDMVKEYPFLGIGFRAFPEYFHNYYAPYAPDDLRRIANKREVAHNTLIEVSSENGLIGLAIYLWMYFYVFSLNRASRRLVEKLGRPELNVWANTAFGFNIANIVFLIGAFFMSVSLYPYIYFMLAFSFALKYSLQKELDGIIRR